MMGIKKARFRCMPPTPTTGLTHDLLPRRSVEQFCMSIENGGSIWRSELLEKYFAPGITK
jgi:hypothetical protein